MLKAKLGGVAPAVVIPPPPVVVAPPAGPPVPPRREPEVPVVAPPPPARVDEPTPIPAPTPAVAPPDKPAPVKVLPLPGEKPAPGVAVPKFKPKPRPVKIKEEKIVATTVQYVAITAQTQVLEAMPQSTADEQRAMKNKAISILMGLQNLVTQKAPTSAQRKTLVENVEKILNVNPLGIHVAIQLLKKAGVDQEVLYDLMKRFFENKVNYLEAEFNKIKVGQLLNFDVRYNIEEAFFYPETIKEDLETARKAGTDRSRRFSNDMNNLYERLVKLLREHKEKLRTVDVPVEIYERKVGKEPIYCVAQPYDHNKQEYKSIFKHLDELADGVNAYYKPHTTQRLRNYVINETIKMLKDIVAIYQTSCPICLGEELERYDREPETRTKVNEQFEVFNKFLKDIKAQKETFDNFNSLQKLFTDPTCRRLRY